MKTRSIWVVGIHRSGTSALAGALHHLGINMSTMEPPEFSHPPSNPKGQYEDEEMVRILRKLIGNWRDPIDWLWRPEANGPFHEYVRRRDIEDGPIWGAKSPQLCLTWPLVAEVAQDPLLVLCVRDTDASVKSLMAREPLPRIVAERIVAQYWLGMMHCVAAAQKHKVPIVTVPYKSLIRNGMSAIDDLSRLLFNGTGIVPTDEQKAAAVAHIDPTLCHHGAPDVRPR